MTEKADLKNKIKEMENKKREESAPKIEVDKKVSYDSWYHKRKANIPKAHRKEVIWADFTARKMDKEAAMSEYDKALELYGVKL